MNAKSRWFAFAILLAARPAAGQVRPLCQTGCIPAVPRAGFYYNEFPDHQIVPPETGPYSYSIYVINVGTAGGTFEVWCGGLQCSASPDNFFLAMWDSVQVTVTYSAGGLGHWGHTLHAMATNENGGHTDSLRQAALTVIGPPIAAHLNPLDQANYAITDTMKAVFSHPSGVDSGSFRLLIDGRDSTTRATKTLTSITARNLGLSAGVHTFGTRVCALNGRCDSLFTAFTTPGGVNYALDDSLGPIAGAGLVGLLPGALPLISTDSGRGCPVHYDDPEIRLTTPMSYITQPADSAAGLPVGYIFRASAFFGSTLPMVMSAHDWKVADSTNCGNTSVHRVRTYSYLTSGQYDWTFWHDPVTTDPLWDSYPYGDRGGSWDDDDEDDGLDAPFPTHGPSAPDVSLPRSHGGWNRAGRATTRARARRLGVAVRAVEQNPGAINPNSYKLWLNGTLIVDNSTPVNGMGVTKIYADLPGAEFDMATASGLLHHYNPSIPSSDNGGWNEVIASVADSTNHRTYVRARFAVGSGNLPAPIALKPLRDFSRLDQGECAAFGAFQCGGVMLTQSLPGFVTRDKHRGLHLVYRSASQRAAQLLPIDVQIGRAQAAPDSVWAWPTDGGVSVGGTMRYYGTKRPAGITETDTLWDDAVVEHRVLGVSVDNGISGNVAIRTIKTVARSFYPDSATPEDTVSQEVVYLQLSDTTMTRFGQGWALAEQSRVIFGQTSKGAPAAIWLSGDGSYSVYRQVGGVWVAPPGETARLVDSSASMVLPVNHVLFLDNGASIGFRTDGWQVYTADLVGNKTRFLYNSATSSRLDSIADPSGIRYDFSYTSGSVTGVTIHSGASTRTVATLGYDGSGRLTKVAIPRTASLTDTTWFAYLTGAPGAYVQSVTDPRSTPSVPIVTTFTYDALYYLPTSTTRPPDRNGAGETDFRDPLRRALPRANRGRPGYLAERLAWFNWFKGTLVDVAFRPSDFTVDRFGGPTMVRRYAPAVGSPSCPNVFPPIAACADDVRRIDRDTVGRVVKIVADPDYPNVSDSITYHYDALSRVDTLIRNTAQWPISGPTRDTITYVYDSVTVDPTSGAGRAWCSRLKSMRDQMGGVTSVVYGSSGAGADRCLPQKTIGLAADTTIFTYGTLTAGNVWGVRPVSVRDPNGIVDSMQYDGATWNSLRNIRKADTATSIAYYNAFGWMDSTVDAVGVRSDLRYDLSGRVVKTRTGPNASTTTPTVANFYGRGGVLDSTEVYNSAGIDAVATGTIQTTKNYFDRLAQLDSTLTPGTAQTRRNHHVLRDRYGSPVLDYPGNGTYVGRVTDWQGRATSIALSQVYPGYSVDGQPFADATTNSTYLSYGMSAGPTLSAGQGYTLTYDERGRVIGEQGVQVAQPGTTFYSRSRSFSRVGAVTGETLTYGDGLTVMRGFQYNRRGQRLKMTDSLVVTSGSWASGAETKGVLRYYYNDATARLDSLVDSSGAKRVGRARWLFDRGGRDTLHAVLLDSADAELVTVTRYDAAGRRSFQQTNKPSGANAAIWSQFTTPSYTKADELLSFAGFEPNGTTTPSPQTRTFAFTYATDGTRRLLTSTKNGGAGLLASYTWTYDAFGNRLTEARNITTGAGCDNTESQASTFAVDNALVRTTGVCNRLNHFYSDRAGNRLFQLDSVMTGSGSYGAQNLESYTALGQLYFSMTATGGASLFDYNWHFYDAAGTRIETIVLNGSSYTPGSLPGSSSGTRTFQIYDGSEVALAVVKSGSQWWVHQRYITGGVDQPLAGRFAQQASATAQNLVLVADYQGSTIAAVKRDGTQETNAPYWGHSPYGALEGPSGSGGSTNPGTGFTGASSPNATGGFVYLRNRWYDPKTGRFLTQDPIGLAGGVNLYSYAGNNPVSFDDPFGLCEGEDGKWRRCKVELSPDGRALGANMNDLTPETKEKLQDVADAADRDLGINATRNGTHDDWRHSTGEGADIGFINGKDIGSGSTTAPGMRTEAGQVQAAAASLSGELRVASNLGPMGKYLGAAGPLPIQNPRLAAAHANHIHLTFNRGRGSPSFWTRANRDALNALSP
jgi:RHS repeat-associated protein